MSGPSPLAPVRILIDAPLPESNAARIRQLSPEFDLSYVQAGGSPSPQDLETAEIIYTCNANFDPDLAPRLRWVQLNTAAINNVLDKPLLNSRVPFADVSGAYSVPVAEWVMAALLAMTRRIPHAVHLQSRHHYDSESMQGEDLQGKTVGIIGYGSIGRVVARMATAFGMSILACKRQPGVRVDPTYQPPGMGDPDGELPRDWFGADRMEEMVARSDVTIVILPATPYTEKLISRRILEAVPRHGYFISVGRGSVVDEEALIDCMRAGRFKGAALDVTAHEPLPPESPLWDLSNVLLTPHIASWTTTQARRASDVLVENLSRDLKRLPLLNLVDREWMY